jgi:hypothetical protein
MYYDLVKELKEVVIKHQEKSGWNNDSRGFDFYMLSVFTQRGGAYRFDYFTHLDRKWCENNVFTRLRSDYY